MNAEDILIDILETFNFPVIRQGSMLPDEAYPDNFFTFWTNDSISDKFYDNCENVFIYDFDVSFYSNDPSAVYRYLRLAVNKLKSAGFIISGDGHDIASDEITHDGRGVSCTYIDKNNILKGD